MAFMMLEWVFTSIFLILVVLALRAALGKRMSAGLRYALWAVVLVRLLVPVQLFTSPIAGTWVAAEQRTEHQITDWPAVSAAPVNAPGDSALGLPVKDAASENVPAPPVLPDAPTVPDAPEPPDLSNPPEWLASLGWVWLAGSAAVAFVLLVSNLWFFWKLRRERIPLDGADQPLRVYMAVGLPSPCLFGLIRPAIYVTPEAAANPDMLRHVLAHEHTHYRHGDHIWSLLRCTALAVHWWNPLVWVAVRLSRRDGELACDEGALKRLGDGERAGYGGTLLALVTAKPRPGDLFRCSTTMAGDKKSLKERISRIAAAPKCAVWAVVVAVLVTALACQCAFGQAAELEADDPVSSADLAVSAGPLSTEGEPEDWNDLPAHFTVDVEGIPEDVLHFVGEEARESCADLRKYWGEHHAGPVVIDDWRVNTLNGPWTGKAGDMDVEVWQFNYEAHTTTPDKVENFIDGDAYLTEDGWLRNVARDSSYVVFLVNGAGKRGLLMTYFSHDGDVTPGDAEAYFQWLSGLLEGKVHPSDFPQTDLNRNGVPETLEVYMIYGGSGQRLDVREGGEVIYSEEGHYAHVGYNSVFLCTLDGEDYLLRYNPYMGQGWCTYSYKLFTLENGVETAARENSVEFDINFAPFMHESFDPEAIAAFTDEVNGLLAHSVQLFNTDEDLVASFEREGRLYDRLSFLDSWEPAFVRDENASLEENLRAYQKAMEKEWYVAEPILFYRDELGRDVRLCYHDKEVRIDAVWDMINPSTAYPEVLDLNGDGRDEIVFSLVEGHGTGALVEKLYVFDADTLEQYDTSGLNEEILRSIKSTGDEDNFYLQGPGMPGPVTLNKHAPRDNPGAPVADVIGLGDIIRYTVSDGVVYCWLGCDMSGALIGYEGYLKVWLEFTDAGSFQGWRCDYVGSIEP